jgi:hypothetical protein
MQDASEMDSPLSDRHYEILADLCLRLAKRNLEEKKKKETIEFQQERKAV